MNICNVWNCSYTAESANEFVTATLSALADAAEADNWPRVLEILAKDGAFINCCRLGGTSLFAPLHHAAHAGVPVEVVQCLIECGAWRSLRDARGERPVDIAERMGHRHLSGILQPQFKKQVPLDVLLKIQSHFHAVIRAQIRTDGLRLPDLEPMLELDPPMFFPVHGMFGGFNYCLEAIGAEAKLVSESWSRVVDGAGKRHEITSEGSRLVAEGL